jgi:hypothetical protein
VSRNRYTRGGRTMRPASTATTSSARNVAGAPAASVDGDLVDE